MYSSRSSRCCVPGTELEESTSKLLFFTCLNVHLRPFLPNEGPHSVWSDQANHGNHDIRPELRRRHSRHWSPEDELRQSRPVLSRMIRGSSGDLGNLIWQFAGIGESRAGIRFLRIFEIDHRKRIIRPKKETAFCAGVHGLRCAICREWMEPWNHRLSRNCHADTAWIDNSESCMPSLRQRQMT